MVKKVTLTKEKVMDSWSYLIDSAAGKTEQFFDSVANLVEEQLVSELKAERVKAFSGLGGKLFSRASSGKDYLLVEHKAIDHTKIYVRAMDYGKNLFVAWYMIAEPGTFREFLTAAKEFGQDEKSRWFSEGENVFSQEEITAYATCVHRCVLEAVEKIMRELGQDVSDIVNRKSRGFLGVS